MKLYLNVYDKGQTVRLHTSKESADNAANDGIGDDREACIETSLDMVRNAPELLRALKACLDQLEYEPKRYAALLDRAYKLIAKAESQEE